MSRIEKSKVFSHLREHKKILVTGPHRSGTTIAATMIANDTGHGLVREELCRFSRKGVEHWINEVNAPVVIQAPFAADICHMFPKALVVFMFRNLDEINESRARAKVDTGKRVDWRGLDRNAMKGYHTTDYKDDLKYQNWALQRDRLRYSMDLDYSTLNKHPLWIDKPFRKDWYVRQTNAVA